MERDEPHRVTIYANCVVSADDPEEARAALRQVTAETLGGEANVQLSPLPYAQELLALIERGTDTLQSEMPDAWLDDLAIGGSPERAVDAIRRLAEAGADAVVLVPPAWADQDAWLETIGRDLLPLARESSGE